jgi:hypothetical protein
MRAAFSTISPVTHSLQSCHFPRGSPTKMADELTVGSKRGHESFLQSVYTCPGAPPGNLCWGTGNPSPSVEATNWCSLPSTLKIPRGLPPLSIRLRA